MSLVLAILVRPRAALQGVRRARGLLRGRVSLAWWNPDPTGQKDSTAAFQAAYDGLDRWGGGTIDVGRGTFMFGDLRPRWGTTLAGQGLRPVFENDIAPR